MAGPFFKSGGRLLGRFLRACGHGDQINLHRCQGAAVFVQPHTGELAGNAKALQIGIGAQVDISAEHAGTDEGYL